MLNTIFGIIGWVGTLLVFVALAIRMFRPQWDQYAYWAAIAGLVLVLLYTLSQWREILRSFQKRETKLGAMTSISVIAVLAILVGVNYLVSRRDKRWDLTAAGTYTLSEQTIKVLNNLKTPVKFVVFGRPNEDIPRFRDALTPYQFASRNVQVEYIDADRQPARVKEYNVSNYGTVVLEYDGRRENVMSDREQELTNGLIKVTTGRQIKAYFLEGHGEKNYMGSDRNGYANTVEVLKRDNYTVDRVVLAQTPEGVPADASVLIVAGPTSDYLKPEVDAIRTYLRKGGKVLFLLDPPVTETARSMPTLEALLKEWGITLGHDVVIDASGMGQLFGADASVPVVTTYPAHPVTQDFERVITAYPLAQSVKGEAGVELGTANTQNLLNTGERSWSESDLKSVTTGKPTLDEKAGDQRGPITIALSLSMDAPDAPGAATAAVGDKPADPKTAPPKPQMRLIVVGDSDFAANLASGIQGNADLFVNMNNWLTQQEDLISIHPKDSGDRRITMTADQQRRVFWLSMLVIPGLILGSGIYTWWQRR
jgi:ABC-type uncharacterized transport system involved in gliding motility auxiliary subunit